MTLELIWIGNTLVERETVIVIGLVLAFVFACGLATLGSLGERD